MKMPWWCRAGFLVILTVLVGCQPAETPVQDTPGTPSATQAKPTPSTGVIVSLYAPDTQVKVGDTLEVAVGIDRVENLIGAEVHVQYDAQFLQVEDVEPEEEGVQVAHGTFLQPDFVVINLGDNQTGILDYAIAQMPPHNAVNGNGQLFTIRLQAMAPGSSDIVLKEVVLADASAQEIPIALVIDTLTITIE